MTPVPVQNQYEHLMVFIEQVDNEGEISLGMSAVAVDLSPDKPVTLRQVSKEEVGEDMDNYVNAARTSMDQVVDRMIEQVMKACEANGEPIEHYGFIDLVEQFQDAPHLLLANMLAAVIASTSQSVMEPDEPQPVDVGSGGDWAGIPTPTTPGDDQSPSGAVGASG